MENLCEYFRDNDQLVHLDISGMGFSHKEGELLRICGVIASECDNLLAIHINDSYIVDEMKDEILDMFGIKSQPPRHQVSNNFPVCDPYHLQEVVTSYTNSVPQDQI